MRQDSASDMASAASLPGGGRDQGSRPHVQNATLSLQPRAVYEDMIDDLYYFDIVARRRDPEHKLARIYEVGERPDWLEGEIDEEPEYDYKTGLYTERGLDRPDDPLLQRPQKGDSTFESWMSLKRQRKELEIKRAEQRAQKAKEDAISRGFYDSDNPDAEYDEFGYEYLGVPAKFVDQEELDEQYTKASKLPETPADYPAFREQESSFEKYLHDTVINSTKSLVDRKNLGFLQIVLCPGLNLSNLAFDKNLEPTDDEMDMNNNPEMELSKLRERHQWGMYLGAEQCRGFLAKHSIFYKTYSSTGQDDKTVFLIHPSAKQKTQ
ncbi:unnamed protein product, partial [Aureobasidium pullulans]